MIAPVEVARLDDLPPGSALEVAIQGRTYALFRPVDEVFGVSGLCPHQGGRLARGSVAGSTVTCPRLGCLRWRFDLANGASSVGEAARLDRLEIRIEGGSIWASRPAP